MLLTGCVEDFDTSYPAGDKPESVVMDDLTRGYEVLKNYLLNGVGKLQCGEHH